MSHCLVTSHCPKTAKPSLALRRHDNICKLPLTKTRHCKHVPPCNTQSQARQEQRHAHTHTHTYTQAQNNLLKQRRYRIPLFAPPVPSGSTRLKSRNLTLVPVKDTQAMAVAHSSAKLHGPGSPSKFLGFSALTLGQIWGFWGFGFGGSGA